MRKKKALKQQMAFYLVIVVKEEAELTELLGFRTVSIVRILKN
jgi:hypothetical protein